LGFELHFRWGLSYLSAKLLCPRNSVPLVTLR
jgi:hypothetical protein